MGLNQSQNLTISDLLKNNQAIYQVPDDRLYTIEDLLYNHQKFISLFIEDKDQNKIKFALPNLMVALAWYLALANRYHIDLESSLWKRYSYKCPFCMEIPCMCDEKETLKAQKTGRPSSRKPESIAEWQKMIEKIYPLENIDNPIFKIHMHLDRLNSAFRLFMREKKKKQFHSIENEIVDYFVILVRIFNYYHFDIEKEYIKMFSNGCYVCHQIPCECNYYE